MGRLHELQRAPATDTPAQTTPAVAPAPDPDATAEAWGSSPELDAARSSVAAQAAMVPRVVLGGAQLGAATLQRDQAVEAHLAQQARVYALIQRGLRVQPTAGAGVLDRATLFRNACQWIHAGICTMSVHSPTHDHGSRHPGRLSYFGRDVLYPASGGTYAPLPAADGSDPTVETVPVGLQGGMSRHHLALYQPSSKPDDETLIDILIHEVQHDADETSPRKEDQTRSGIGKIEVPKVGGGGRDLQAEGWFGTYQSEFRAHWVQTEEGSPGDSFGSSTKPATNARAAKSADPTGATADVPTHFQNQRQERIFWHLQANGYDVEGHYADDERYRTMVDGFTQPRSVNVVNSVRIHALAVAIDACTPEMKTSNAAVRAALAATRALDGADRRFLKDATLAGPFWAVVQQHLDTDAARAMADAIADPVSDVGDFPHDPSWPDVDTSAG